MASSSESSSFDDESTSDSEFDQQWVSDDDQIPSSPSLLHFPLPFNFLPSDEQGDEDLEYEDEDEDEDDELLREFLEQSEQSDNSSDEDSEDSEDESDSTSEASEDSLFVAQGPRSAQPIDEFLRTVEEHSASVRDLVRQVRLQEEQQADRLLRQLVGPPGHPYRRRARTMSNRPRTDSEEFEDAELDDELIMMEIEQRPRRRATPGPRAARTALAANAEVIDLTNVPDSPDEPARRSLLQPRAPPAVSSVAPHRNPRRQGLSQRTPSLTRSDGSLLGNSAEVIDLTLDDDAPAPQQPPQPRHIDRARFGPPPRRRFNDHSLLPLSARDFALGGIAGGIMDALGGFGFFQQVLNRQHPAAELEVHMLGGPGVNPLGANAPNLNYGGYGGGSRASPKPAYTPPPKAREGFTRSTVTSDEDVVVCPGCEEELQYDPDENSQSAPAAKKAKTRKDQEEHYFWAVKECGHVYCKTCYENRAKGKNMIPPTFRTALVGKTKKTLCNVPDCDSDVTSKTAWVGIFL